MTDEGFSFRSLIKPGEGAMAAVKKEVERLAANEHFTPGRWYGGPGEMLKMHGTYFNGSVLPEQYDGSIGPMTHCHTNALALCEEHRELRYFTGLYAVGPGISSHSWGVDPDGNVIEVTFPTKERDPADPLGKWRLPDYRGTKDTAHRGSLGWTPPATWAYVGLEFDVDFVRRWYTQTSALPLLDLIGELPSGLAERPFLKPYKASGFAIPDDIEMESYIAALRAEASLEAEWDPEDDDYNPEEPEFI